MNALIIDELYHNYNKKTVNKTFCCPNLQFYETTNRTLLQMYR